MLCVQGIDLFPVRFRQGHTFEESHALARILIRVIRTQENPVYPHGVFGANKGGLQIVSARRHEHVVLEIVARPFFEGRQETRIFLEMGSRKGEIDSLENERQPFAQMPQDDSQLWKGVEDAAEDESHHGHGRFDPKSEGCSGQGEPVGPELGNDRSGWMEIDRYVEFFSFRENGPINLFINVGIAVI